MNWLKRILQRWLEVPTTTVNNNFVLRTDTQRQVVSMAARNAMRAHNRQRG